MSSAWGDSWGLAWGDSWGAIAVGGGAVKIRGKKKKKKWDDLTEADIQGMKAVYGQGFEKPTIQAVAEPEIVEAPIISLDGDYLDSLSVEDGIKLLDSQIEMSPEVRRELEMAQDIGLILAIIEALD